MPCWDRPGTETREPQLPPKKSSLEDIPCSETDGSATRLATNTTQSQCCGQVRGQSEHNLNSAFADAQFCL